MKAGGARTTTSKRSRASRKSRSTSKASPVTVRTASFTLHKPAFACTRARAASALAAHVALHACAVHAMVVKPAGLLAAQDGRGEAHAVFLEHHLFRRLPQRR